MGKRTVDGCEGEFRPDVAARKPWAAPTLTVTSIEESTNGTQASTPPDAVENAVS